MKDFLTTTQTDPPQIPLPYYLLMLLAMVALSYLSWRWYKNNIWRWTFLIIQAFNSLPYTLGTSGRASRFILVCPCTIVVWPCLLFSS